MKKLLFSLLAVASLASCGYKNVQVQTQHGIETVETIEDLKAGQQVFIQGGAHTLAVTKDNTLLSSITATVISVK